MKGRSLFQKMLIKIVFLLLFIGINGVTTATAELATESGIIELAVPSTGQTFYRAAGTYHDVALAKDGSFVVVWVYKKGSTFSTIEPEDDYTLPVYARRFNADGSPQTGIVEVCEAIPYEDNLWNTCPRVATDDFGNFVVCWTKYRVDKHQRHTQEIYARMFDADGNPRNTEYKVNDDDNLVAEPMAGAVDMNSAGEFVITWNGDRIGLFEGEDIIYAKRFDSSGLAINAKPIKVNPMLERAIPLNQINSRPSVAINADGEFAVSWSTRYLIYSNVMTIGQGFIVNHMARRFNQYGLPMGPARNVDTIRHFDPVSPKGRWCSDASPVIAMNDNGAYAVSHFRYVYSSNSTRKNYHDMGYRFYSRAGLPLSTDQKTDILMKENSLVNTLDNAGNLVMAWVGCNGNEGCEGNEAIYLMRTSRSSASDCVCVSENAPHDPFGNSPDISYPSLDTSPDGRIVVVWHNNENLLGRIYTIQ